MSDVQAEQPVDASPASTEPQAVEQPPVDNAYVAEGCEQFAAPVPAHAALGPLQRIEDIAIQWGGDVMTELRHLVAEVRSLL